jgi:magnesium-protoporphyrin IX monomethyl ester (oxidative) cyclase
VQGGGRQLSELPEYAIAPADVCLVLMPYAALERPTIALSILKAVLAKADIPATIVYANILFAEEIGVFTHDIVGKTQSHSLAGEWTFASAVFRDFEPDNDAYFRHIGRGLEGLVRLVRSHGGRGQMPHILAAVRKRAPQFVDRLARRIVATGPKIVGCSSTFQQHCASLALLRRIKELMPEVTTVIGGANCESSMGLATHRECSWVDFVVSGEGEEPFLALCGQLLERPRQLARSEGRLLPVRHRTSIEGVIGPEDREAGYAALRRQPPRARLEDMNRSPIPDYDDYFYILEKSPVGLYVKPGLLIETSRGCWWGEVSHCTFCGLNGTSMAYRAKSAARVVDEFGNLSRRYGIKTFEVVDNIISMSYFKTVLSQLGERQDGYDIFYETKANLSRAHLEKMAAAGVRWLQPGIESFDDGILRSMGKGTTGRQNLQLLKWAQDYGIYVLWIFLYDIPGESDDLYLKMAEWLPLVSHLQPPSGVSFIQFNRFSPYQTRPQDFNIHVSADRSYSFVYPWPKESIEDFAYFFDDYTVDRDLIDGSNQLPKRPGLRELYRKVSQWQTQWTGSMNAGAPASEPARLVAHRDGPRLVISDSRQCRVAEELVVEGLGVEVYQACDQARTATGMIREIAATSGRGVTWNDIAPLVSDLCEKKVLMHVDDWYLSLASRARLPALNIVDYPGGRLRTVAEAEAAELAAYAASQLTASSGPFR